MEALKTTLFENPLGIYIALAIIAALGLVSYQTWRTLKSAWPTTLALLVGAVVFTVSTLVVTDREQIHATCEKIVNTINDRNTQILDRFIDKDFTGTREYQTRDKAIRRLAGKLDDYKVTSVRFQILKLNVRGDLATMEVRSDITTETIPATRLNWRVAWIRRSTGWMVFKANGPLSGPPAAENEEE